MKKEGRNLRKLKRLLFLSCKSSALKNGDCSYCPNRKHRKQKIVNNNQHSVGTKDHACPTSHLLPPDLTVLPLILIITLGCQHLMTSLWKPQRTTVSETGELTRPGRKRNQLAGSGAYLKTQESLALTLTLWFHSTFIWSYLCIPLHYCNTVSLEADSHHSPYV